MIQMLKDSVIIIDKPPGMTSHETTTHVKKITGVGRAGHAGTLDPQVSGVLPVALGRATKFLRYIAGKDKTYVGIIKFRNVMGKEEIEKLFKEFTGEITQTPPRISAVRKVPRKRHVHHLRLLEVQGRLALFEAKVDAGTYIRTLCSDMGKRCGGARMEELRRTAVGGITEKESSTMQELVDAVWFRDNKGDAGMLERMLRKPESLIGLPRVSIKESALASVLSGAQIMAPAVEKVDAVEKGDRVAIYCKERFIGVGVAQVPGSEMAGRGLAVKLERMRSNPLK
jgi:H/ACA ribonucleoprotein complex subunit 4